MHAILRRLESGEGGWAAEFGARAIGAALLGLCAAASTALGGMIPLFNMQLGEIVIGGVGAGIYGFLLYALLAVFVAGLMVGRTPEYVGKKIDSREVKLAVLAIAVLPLCILGFTALAAVLPQGLAGPLNKGPHGFTDPRPIAPQHMGAGHESDVEYLRVAARGVRNKLEGETTPSLIRNEPGIGYRLVG